MSVCAEEGWVHGRSFQRVRVTVSTFPASARPWTDRANRRQLLTETCLRRAVPQEPSTAHSSRSSPMSLSMAGWRRAGLRPFRRTALCAHSLRARCFLRLTVTLAAGPVAPSPSSPAPETTPEHLRARRARSRARMETGCQASSCSLLPHPDPPIFKPDGQATIAQVCVLSAKQE